MLLAREQWAGKLHCPQHDSPIVGVWNLLVMALFLGLWLFAVEEHRMSFTLFLVICILLWMSNTFREGFWMLKEGRRGYFPPPLCCTWSLSHVWLFATPWTIAWQAPLSMGLVLQARILERVAMPSFRASSQPRDQTQVSRIAGGFFTIWAPREAQEYWSG